MRQGERADGATAVIRAIFLVCAAFGIGGCIYFSVELWLNQSLINGKRYDGMDGMIPMIGIGVSVMVWLLFSVLYLALRIRQQRHAKVEASREEH